MAVDTTVTTPDAAVPPDVADHARHRLVFLRNRKVAAGVLILVVFTVIAVVGRRIAPYDPAAFGPTIMAPPSARHWLGTTNLGQDILSQLLVGTRGVMIVGFLAGTIATALAVLVGVTAGYLGGVADEVLSALSNIFLVIPALPLVIIIAGQLPDGGPLVIALVIAVTGWAWGVADPARTDAVTAPPRLRRGGPRQRRVAVAHPRLRDPAEPHRDHRVELRGHGDLRDPVADRAGVHRRHIDQRVELGHDPVLGAVEPGAGTWRMVVVRAGRPVHRAAGHGAHADQLRDRRVRQPTPAQHRPARPRHAASRHRGARRLHPGGAPTRGGTVMTDVLAGPGPALRPGAPGPVLDVRDLRVDYGYGADPIHVLRGVSLTLRRGEVLGLAGESGCGKSTLAYAATRLLSPPGVITGGRVLFTRPDGERVDLLDLNEPALRALRWRDVAIVFQGAMNSLNPVHRLSVQLTDAIRAHRPELPRAALAERATELVELVGISADRLRAFPHQLSGGMRQRAMIAMALALEPQVLIMDEPTTALDVVMQRQIVEQITQLRDRLGFAVIFITHDVSLLIEIADRIAIMYAGEIVEEGTAHEVYRRPRHPYTRGLLTSFPPLHGPRRALGGIAGSPPDLQRLPPGCAFADRCAFAFDRCRTEAPALAPTAFGDTEPGRLVACHLHDRTPAALPPELAARP
jgi:oligopeptide/dipeptide ABC transporter ATP-binding protein